MAELGNLTGRILLSLRRMSTVKIRARSLFRTPPSRGGAVGEGNKGLGTAFTGAGRQTLRPQRIFPPSSTAPITPSQVVHRQIALRACEKPAFRCKVRGVQSREGSR